MIRLSRFQVAVATILALALALRIAAVLFASNFPPGYDADDYIRHGQSIAAGHGFPPSWITADTGPSALRPPLYPYFVGAIFSLRRDSARAVRLAQALAGTAAAGLLGLLAWQVFGSRRVALAGLAMGAVYPVFVFSATPILSEAIFLPIELAAVAAAWQFRRDHGRLRFAVLAGVIVGVATLTRQTGVLLAVPVTAALVAALHLSVARRWGATALAAIVASTVLVPWIVRNAVDLHAFVPVSVQTGLQLAGIYNDESRNDPITPALWRFGVIPRDTPLYRRHGFTEVDLDRELTRNALDYARSHPTYVVSAVSLNSLRMLQIDDAASEKWGAATWNQTPGPALLSRLGFYAAVLLAVAGLFTRAVRRVPRWFWITPLVFFAAGAATAALLRYRAPIDPFVLLLGAPVLVAAWERVAGKPRLRAADESLAWER